jgi:flagellar biosynthesis/type III secretory pathway protein FliH
MAVIKSHNSATLLKDAIVLDLGDVSRQAQRIRASAEAKARQLIADAQRDAMAHRKHIHDDSAAQGHEEGFGKGLEAGREQGRQEAYQQAGEQLQEIQQGWVDAISQLDDQRQAMERDARQAVLELAIRFAAKLTHRVIEVDDQVVLGQLEAVLSQVLRPMEVTVRICPDDRQVLEEAMSQLLAQFAQVQRVHLVDDAQVGPGGCVLNYGQGQIDATIQTQLQRLVELMLPGGVQGLVVDENLCPKNPENSENPQTQDDVQQPPQDRPDQ